MRTLLIVLALMLAWPAHAVMTAAGAEGVVAAAPVDDPGWANFVITDSASSSGIYIGNRWILSAGHTMFTTVHIGGTQYTCDSDSHFPPITDGWPSINGFRHPDNGVADIRMCRLTVDPGLPAIPIAASAAVVGEDLVMIGNCGTCERAAARSCTDGDGLHEGWQRGSGGLTLRWGTNKVYQVGGVGIGAWFTTDFSLPADPSFTTYEAQGYTGDSGGPTFVKRGGVWQLVGIMVSVGHPSCTTNDDILSSSTTTNVELSYFRDEILLRAGLASSLSPWVRQ